MSGIWTPEIERERGGNEAIEHLESIALTIAHRTGGLDIHASEGGWCVHVGPPNRYLGCSVQTFAGAVLHAFSHIDPESGAPVGVELMTKENASEKNDHPETSTPTPEREEA